MIVIKRNTNNKLMVFVIMLALSVPVLCVPPSVTAQDPSAGTRQGRSSFQGGQPLVMINSSPEYPVEGSKWVLTVLVAHDNPEEVEVQAPPFIDSFSLEQMVKGPRVVNLNEHWTAVDYHFVLHGSGTITFDAFTVITPGGQKTTVPFDVEVREPPGPGAAGAQIHRLVWEGIPPAIGIGESAILRLRFGGSIPPVSPPETRLLVPPVPVGHILESLPLTPEEKSAGTALKLRLIPLEAVPFVLESRRVSPDRGGSAGNTAVFEIPALRITVRPVRGTPPAGGGAALPAIEPPPEADGNLSGGGVVSNRTLVPAFPSLETAAAGHSDLFRKHRTQCEAAYGAAKDLWEGGYFAEALAALRQTEKDHPAGRLFAGIRRGAEQMLGFTGTNDEHRRILPQFIAKIFNRKSNSAVLRETVIRHIPDQTGEAIRILGEGQPVLVLQRGSNRNKWLMVITNDNIRTSGWVPEENIVFY